MATQAEVKTRIADPGNGFNGLIEPITDIPGNYAGDPSLSIAISLKRIADALHNPSSTGSVLWWLEQIACAADAARS
jgi:hypothetical protein